MIKKKAESKNYVIVECPRINVTTAQGVLELLEGIRDEKLRPIHRLEGAFGNCFVCEKA